MNKTSGLNSYWSQAALPLQSLVFVLPMLLAYELGLLSLGADAVHNGADQWLRRALSAVGFGQYILLPLLTCAILLAWHHLTHRPWKVSLVTCLGMLGESLLWGAALLLIYRLQDRLLAVFSDTALLLAWKQQTATILGYFGAGIYEELLFRLILLPVIYFTLRGAGAEKRASWAVAIIVSSVLFSGAHYAAFTGAGDAFSWDSFAFRTTAGIFFAALFVTRGFGVAAGAHAAYDIMVHARLF